MTEEMQKIKDELTEDLEKFFITGLFKKVGISLFLVNNKFKCSIYCNKAIPIANINFKKIRHLEFIDEITFNSVAVDLNPIYFLLLFMALTREYNSSNEKDYFPLFILEKNVDIKIIFKDCSFCCDIASAFAYFNFNAMICFDNCYFNKGFSFHFCNFNDSLWFIDCCVEEVLAFKAIKFKKTPRILLTKNKKLVFEFVTFNDQFNFIDLGIKNTQSIIFISSVFENSVVFDKNKQYLKAFIEYNCELVLINTIFKKQVIFGNIKFQDGATLTSLEFKSNVMFSGCFLDSNMNGALVLRGCVFYEKFNFNFIDNINQRELNILEAHFKKDVIFPKPESKEILKSINILKCIFDGRVNFATCDFYEDIKFIQCVFNKDLSFKQTKFIKSFDFIENKVKDNIDFSCVSFEISPNFQSSIFEKLVILYKTKFKEIPNLYSASFSSSAVLDMPLVDIKDYSFSHLKDEIKNKNDLIDIKGIRECLNIFKNALLKTNNILEASKYKVLELYTKELELDYKLEHKKKLEEKITIKEIFDLVFLKLNRNTSDHHTDFLKILLFTLSVIGGYFMINFGLSFDEKIINSICNLVDLGLAMYGVSVVIFLLCLGYEFLFVLKGFSKDKGWLIFIFLAICLFGFRLAYSFNVSEFSVVLPMIFIGILAMLFILLANNVKYTFISFAAAGFIGILCTPNIITPFLGAFSEDARNHYLYKAIDELDSQKALELSRQILAKEPTSELNAKKILKDYKDELKSSDLLDKAPELKRA